MTDRKAIKMLKGFLLITSIAEIEDEEEKEEIEETFQTAISALEEREERRKGMTNSDHIRSMTDDELAAYFMIFRPSDACFDDDEKTIFP